MLATASQYRCFQGFADADAGKNELNGKSQFAIQPPQSAKSG